MPAIQSYKLMAAEVLLRRLHDSKEIIDTRSTGEKSENYTKKLFDLIERCISFGKRHSLLVWLWATCKSGLSIFF